MAIDPLTLEFEDDDIPGPIQVPGSAPAPTFYDVEPGQGVGAAPPPTNDNAAPAADPTQAGILQALDVTQQQESTTTGETSKNETSGKVRTPDVVAAQTAQDAAQADKVAAADERAKAERAAAARDVAKLELEAAVAKQEAADAKRVQAERQRLAQEGQKYVNSQVAEFQAQAAKQNDKYLGDATTGQKVAWGIGLLLGAFGAIKTGRNTAAEMLSDTVDKWDLDRRTKLETARKAVADARTWADKRVRDFLDDEIKLAPLKKAGYLETVASQVEAELTARKGQLNAEGEAKAQEFVAKARAEAADIKAKAATDFAPTSTTGGTTSVSNRQGTVVQTPNAGGRGGAMAQKRLDEMRAAVSGRQDVLNRLNEVKQFVQENKLGPTGFIADPMKRQLLVQKLNGVRLELATAKGRGASFTDSEQAMIDGIAGSVSPNDIFNNVPRIEAAAEQWRDESERSLARWGFDRKGASRAMDVDPGTLDLPGTAQPPPSQRAPVPGPKAPASEAVKNLIKEAKGKPAAKGSSTKERVIGGKTYRMGPDGKYRQVN